MPKHCDLCGDSEGHLLAAECKSREIVLCLPCCRIFETMLNGTRPERLQYDNLFTFYVTNELEGLRNAGS